MESSQQLKQDANGTFVSSLKHLLWYHWQHKFQKWLSEDIFWKVKKVVQL